MLAVNNTEVVYGDVILVLRGLSLEVPKGSIVTLLGPNGAGKSTTLKAISGLLKSEDGEITRGDIQFEGSGSAGWSRTALCAVASSRLWRDGASSPT
jgi:branched-chain amino acid transport system ATP-binding protein